jgi:phosphatidylserine/phosphatidylglycerophosphate/cardiolipin synthase-like enzyme
LTDEPTYWGSWKGRVIKSITIDHAQTWPDIREATGLSRKALNRVLKELYDVHVIYQNPKGTYWVETDLFKQYAEYFKTRTEAEPEKIPKFQEKDQENLVLYIDQWKGLKKLVIDLRNKHFFLSGRYLDELSRDLIVQAKSEVLVVNPYVEKCTLSDSMREVSDKVDVILLTRPPEMDQEKFQERKKEHHSHLKQDKVDVVYNKVVHAKIIVVDRAVAIVSSMNFNPRSSGGASWEAGLVTIDKKVVEDTLNEVWNVLDKPESQSASQ